VDDILPSCETSRQAQMLIPIATSITLGLMSSTILLLIVIPAFCAIFGDVGLAKIKN
jgi:multidrug efflux pump subunit AcrB